MKSLLSLALSLLLIAQTALTQNPAPPIRGFSPDQFAAQRDREAKARAMIQPERIRTYMERMSADPHHAGSPGSRAVAEYASALLKEWGIESRIDSFEAMMPYPTARILEMTAPTAYKATLQEPPLPEDKDSADPGQLPTFNAYSASGDVSGQLVYVNYGNPEDYETIKKLGVDVRGKIVIARYGNGWRGNKPKLAAENGAIGCILYSDPKEDGYYRGDVYPKGPYRPPQGVQRGSVMDVALYPGDPLTPGWASEKGGRRLSREEAKTLTRIPVMPISYRDAAPLLRALMGPVAPEPWRGALALTYHIGAGPATVRLKLDFDWSAKPVHNVIGVIPGSVYKDQWVILGNHHDAWVNGAGDPISGASALMETARVLSRMVKNGWKPKRTIVLALWDGQEFGMIGSTEWAEKYKAELDQKAVAYINTDSNGRGPFAASGSPMLEQFVNEVLRDVNDPVSGKSLLDSPRPKRGGGPGGARLGPLGAGSDFLAFADHIGVSSLNLGFGSEGGGVYHSAYDSFAYFQKFSDADYAYGRALSQVTTTMLLRLADAPVVPQQFGELSKAVRVYADEIQKDFPAADLRDLSTHLARLAAAAKAFDDETAVVSRRFAGGSPDKLTKLNRTIYRAERSLLLPQGLPGREWYKHQLFAPGLNPGPLAAKTLPGLREAFEAGRAAEASQQVKNLARALKSCAVQIEEAVAVLKGL
jgi:N-acetylated-alpha-linked acidic dipeptidase